MSTEDTSAAAAATDPSAQQTQAAQAAPGLSMADVEKLLAAKLAAERAALQADFEQKQAQRDAAFKAQLEALQQGGKGKGKPAPAKMEPPVEEAPALITPPKLEEDPAYLALKQAREADAARLAEFEKQLKAEQNARERAEEQAREQERFQALFKELTDLENPSRTDPEGGQMAAKWILSQHKVTRSKQTGGYYVETRDPQSGEAKTVALKEWIQQWGQTNEGRRFRPALPSGAGTTSGFGAGVPPGKERRPLNDEEAIAAARDQDRRRRAQLGRSALN